MRKNPTSFVLQYDFFLVVSAQAVRHALVSVLDGTYTMDQINAEEDRTLHMTQYQVEVS